MPDRQNRDIELRVELGGIPGVYRHARFQLR
jgi:hypothetical protein